MRRPPRRRDQPIISRGLLIRSFLWLGMIEAILCYSGIIALYGFSGNISLLDIPLLNTIPFPQLINIPVEKLPLLASTVFFAGVVTSQVGNAFAARTERARGRWLGWTSNRFLLAGVAIELLIALVLIYTPVNQIFDLTPLPATFWPWLCLYAPILYTLDWLRKGILRRQKRTQNKVGAMTAT